MAAQNTYMTFLMYSTDGSSYTDLVPIKDYPDFLNEVSTIDVTNLQNANHTYIAGLNDTGGSLDFTCNYDQSDYTTVKGLDDGTDKYVAIWFGGTESGGTVTPDGAFGKWKFKAMVKVGIVGKGVDEAREMTIHLTPTTNITFTAGAGSH